MPITSMRRGGTNFVSCTKMVWSCMHLSLLDQAQLTPLTTKMGSFPAMIASTTRGVLRGTP